jgi:RNA polymerase sigma-70 factor (sigma-E family)
MMTAAGVGFADFVHENSRALYATALILTRSESAAEELLQDTLARLYPRWERVASADSPIAYVRRAVINGFVSGQRRRRREVPVWAVPEGGSQADVAEAVSERGALLERLSTLPPRQRAAIVMRYLYDRPDDEIAKALDCRVATVRSLISRGLVALRAQPAEHSGVAPRSGEGERS